MLPDLHKVKDVGWGPSSQDQVVMRWVTDLGEWIWLAWESSDGCWMVPRDKLRFSAGVPLRLNIRPHFVIPTHLGAVLMLEWNGSLCFLLMSCLADALWAVRRRFERELEEGRRACTTVEKKLVNLRKCRQAMNDYSNRMVKKRLKLLPVELKNFLSQSYLHSHTVLRLTTPDGGLVHSGDETKVAVIGHRWYIIVHFREEKGSNDAEMKIIENGVSMPLLSPFADGDSFHRKAFSKRIDGVVDMLRYVRDPDSNTDAVQLSLVMRDEVRRRTLLPVRSGSGATGRWLVFLPYKSPDVTVYDTETGKMAHLTTPSEPCGAMETSEGLWMWGLHSDFDRWMWDAHTCFYRWSKLFTVDALLSLPYAEPSKIDNSPICAIHRRVVDEALDAEAFSGSKIRNKHPGHYWVVAGYGPVPTRLRAPDHIYKEVETAEQLKVYQGFPFWSVSDSAEPWAVQESYGHLWSAVWAGAVDVRDGVTAASIKEVPETDIWRFGVSVERDGKSEQSGEFSVTGDKLSTMSSMMSLEIPVTAGRWLWKLVDDINAGELTLWHESVSDVNAANCTTRTVLLDLARFECRQAQLDILAPLIPEEGLRAKIAEFTEWVYTAEVPNSQRTWVLLDNALGKRKEWYALKHDGKFQVVPLTGGLRIDIGGRFPLVFSGNNVIRIRASSRREVTRGSRRNRRRR